MLKWLLIVIAVTAITASLIVGMGQTVNGMTRQYREGVESAAATLDDPATFDSEPTIIW